MRQKATSTLLGGLLAALALSAIFASSAAAGPAWHFEGEALSGEEKVIGGAEDSYMTVPGLTTDCENFLYDLDIANESGTGVGDLTEVPLFECGTNSPYCTVDAIEAEELPWSSKLTSTGGNDYIVIEGVLVEVLYGGEQCALNEWVVPVEGSAGGLVNDVTETATFNSKTFEATGTELTALWQPIEWNGVFPTEAFEWHREEALSVK